MWLGALTSKTDFIPPSFIVTVNTTGTAITTAGTVAGTGTIGTKAALHITLIPR
jgi:hypothetical protein